MARVLLVAVAAAIVGLAVWSALPATPPLAAPATRFGSPSASPLPSREAARPLAAEGDLDAKIDACTGAQRLVAAARATRGGPAPAGQPTDAAVVSQACAPLYRQPACRDAMMRFDDPPPAQRSAAVLQACARAYCGLIAAPKPSVCANPDAVPQDQQQYVAWNDLRSAILAHDIGPAAAARVLSPR